MSDTRSTDPLYPNYLTLINNALQAYKERTGTDLVAHSLTARILSCKTPQDTLHILQEQIQELGQSQHRNERLYLVVDALHKFLAPLGEGVAVVWPS
jgi:hypothetical protein